jgi:hypothetical protein
MDGQPVAHPFAFLKSRQFDETGIGTIVLNFSLFHELEEH